MGSGLRRAEEEGEVRYMDGYDASSSKGSLPCPALHLPQIILSTAVQILAFPSPPSHHLYYPSPGVDLEDLVHTDSGRKTGKAGGGQTELRDSSLAAPLASGVTPHPVRCLARSRHGTKVLQMTG